MRFLIPMDSQDVEEAKITKLEDVKVWYQVLIEDGKVQNIAFAKDREDFSELSDGVIVIDDGEYVWPFIEMSMLILVAHTQRYFDDIIEAYIFKELHDLAY
ncbi:hypothetical protein MNB_SM-3-391 [hydrothermal vent metagenome]|uniref:Uncharacterized protein n=1 Tax=hydrothermal vent metagenome TaxID=652676 RepID=A0A1W1D418_9ZZZZ